MAKFSEAVSSRLVNFLASAVPPPLGEASEHEIVLRTGARKEEKASMANKFENNSARLVPLMSMMMKLTLRRARRKTRSRAL